MRKKLEYENSMKMVKMEPAHHQAFTTDRVGGKSSNSNNSGGFSGIYESAAFANILIEFENDNREMAVDVPDSFVAQTKTPPKYPPPSSLGDREEARSSGSSFSALSLSNGHHSLHRGGKNRQSPPDLVTLPARDHLRIGKIIIQNSRLFFELVETDLYISRKRWPVNKYHGATAFADASTKSKNQKIWRRHCKANSWARAKSSPKWIPEAFHQKLAENASTQR